jgi:hypothetical protein
MHSSLTNQLSRLRDFIRRHFGLLRSVAACGIGVAGALLLVKELGGARSIDDWLFFDLAKIWFWAFYLSAACACFGHLIVSRLVDARDRTPFETCALSLPLGLVAFVLGMYAGGFIRLYGPVFAVALPTVMLIVGLPQGFPMLRAAVAASMPRRGGIPLLASLFGTIVLGVLYLGVMSPDAINYDASWNHLVIAQDYAREGRIVPFPGDWVKNLPHLGSIVSAWAFMVPGLPLPALHWMMALHLEFAILVWTLAGVAATAQALAGREVGGTWAVLFLFPGIFVYDSNLGGAADHHLALFAAPLLLVATKALRRFDARMCALWGALAGGAFLTKLHAIYTVVPLVGLALFRAAYVALKRARGGADAPEYSQIVRGLLLAAGTVLAVMSPYFISHLVFFRNPVYPLFQNVFTASTPAVKDAAFLLNTLFIDWRWHPPAAWGERVRRAAEMVFTFSLTPHATFIYKFPVFGSLFSFELPFLLLLKDARRLRFAALAGAGAIFTWAFSFWVDRNLQTFMPMLAAVTAAIMVRVWELGLLARGGIAMLTAIQLAWATPLYFSGKDWVRKDRIAGALALLSSGIEGRARAQLRTYREPYLTLSDSLPKNATVLLHTQHVSLGLDRPTLHDLIGFQGVIDYREFRTPRDLYDRLRALGVTHVVVTPGVASAPSKQEEIVFDAFAASCKVAKKTFGGLEVFPLPDAPPAAEPPYRALSVGIWGYADGLYPVEALSTCEGFPAELEHFAPPSRSAASPWALLPEADAVLVGTGVSIAPDTNGRLTHDFQQIAAYGGFRVLLRNR